MSRRFNNVESLIMSTREKLLGKEVVDNNRPEAEDMHIGDDNREIHQYLPASRNTAGALAKLAVGAGLLATGVGVPIGGWLIADALKSQAKPAPTAPTPTLPEPTTDNDTLFDLELVK